LLLPLFSPDEEESKRFIGKTARLPFCLSCCSGINKLANRFMYLFQMMQSWFGRFSKHGRDIQVQIGQLILGELKYRKDVVTTTIL